MSVGIPEKSQQDKIRVRISELGEWFQNIDLNGVPTAPNHFLGDYPSIKWRRFSRSVPTDLKGKTVLDVGCNAGFYSIEMKRRGADRVLGIDSDEDYLAQARFAAEVCGEHIEFLHMSVYDVARLRERFDIVLFLGVLYHLRHPLLALDLLYEHVTRDILIFQSMLRGSMETPQLDDDYPFTEKTVFNDHYFPRMHFIEKNYAGDPTNWWVPNRACVEALLRSSGFQIIERPEQEIYICRRVPEIKA